MNASHVNVAPAVKEPFRIRKPHAGWLAGVIVLQAVLLTAVGASKAYTLQNGQVVTLKASPVDPYDMFRGEYVSLQFDIAQVPCKTQVNAGDRVFVVLRKHQPYWTAVKTMDKKPHHLAADEIALSGKVVYWDRGKAHINYGLGQYFVAEGRSAEIQHSRLPLDVEVAIDEQGNSAIKRLLYKGKSVE